MCPPFGFYWLKASTRYALNFTEYVHVTLGFFCNVPEASLMSGVLGSPSFQASLKTLSGVEFRWMWKKVHNGRHSLVFFGLQVVKQSDLGHLGSLSCCSINPFPQLWGVWLERDFSLVCIWCRSPSVAKHTQIPNIPTTKFHCGFTLVSFCLLYISFYAWLHIYFFFSFFL